jgi:hypothetical protein
VLKPGGALVLFSCSTGRGREAEKNLANHIASLVPTARVFAATEDINGSIDLDEHNRFVSPHFGGGKAVTYVIEPKVAGGS